MLLLLIPALLILAAFGCYSVVTAFTDPRHWLFVAAEFGLLVCALRVLWVEIGNLRKPGA